MFKTRDFLPVIITALIVFGLAVVTLAQSGACTDNLNCWLVSPFEILFGRYQPSPGASSPATYVLLILTQTGGKAILLVGAFLSSVKIVLSAIRHDFRAALARRMKNHAIICGLGESGMHVARNMHSAGRKVVVIDRAENGVNLATCDRLGIAVIKGDATSPETLKLAGVHNSRIVVASTAEDAANVEVALQVRDLLKGRRADQEPVVVLAEMRSHNLFSRLANRDRRPLGSSDVDLRLFSAEENAARLLLKSLPLPPGPELDGGAFAIVGFGPLGQQLAVHLVRAAPARLGAKARIIVFADDAERCARELQRAYPAAAALAEISFVDAQLTPDSSEDWSDLGERLRRLALRGVAVCLEDDEAGLNAALAVRRELDDCLRIHVPIFLRLGKHRHLGEFAASMDAFGRRPDRLRIFGSLDELFGFDVLVRDELDTLARGLHDQYRTAHQGNNRDYPADLPWNLLPETLKAANRCRADNLPFLLTQAGLTMVPSSVPSVLNLDRGEIELLAALEHRRWTIERQLLGYSYGEVRSDYPPRNELLVDWQQLPELERERNRRDAAGLPAMLAKSNYEIRRVRKIVAVEQGATAALSDLEREIAAKSVGLTVIADVDSEDGRKAANLALELSGVALWLVSSRYPENHTQLRNIDRAFRAAAGWVTRDLFRPGMPV